MSLLEPKTLAQGIRLCIQNARDLIEDAKFLLHHGSHARAFSLAVLAFEELGKVEIIARYYLFPKQKKNREKFIKALRSHSSKQLTSTLVHFAMILMEQGEEELRKRLESPSARERTFDILKQKGFYVDVEGDEFKSPRTFDEKLAKGFLEQTEKQISSYEEPIGGINIEAFLAEIKQHVDEGRKLPEPAEEFHRIIREIIDSEKNDCTD